MRSIFSSAIGPVGLCLSSLTCFLLYLNTPTQEQRNAPPAVAATAETELKVWPKDPPGEPLKVGPEKDFTKATDRLIAGGRIIKLGNVASPELHCFPASKEKSNGTSVVICPGGGFSILAWDLEGTEVAEWLNSIGVSAYVLKYRVPTRSQEKRWLAPAQDCQRAISIVRHNAKGWNLNPDRIGVLGFSAGGATAAMAAIAQKRLYEKVDEVDEVSFQPNFSVLVYPYLFIKPDGSGLMDGLKPGPNFPPSFFVHAFDDGVPVENSLLFAAALKKVKVPAELHIYDAGGHGYGLRKVDTLPVTTWPKRCEEWFERNGWLSK